jgi:serine/threonine protein kinase/Tol biopolymer transport system component
MMKRFEREAKSLAKLSHPNIVSVIDYGEHEGVPYLVMEYLPGGSLKERVTDRPMPWQEALHLLLPVARALQFSHQQGIIHRDVKPSNILITLSGEPMLSDFGIAKILETEGSTALTGTGVGIGTPEYMAPEQWTGNTSPQSDLYSLGVVLYEMVTRRKPYTAETPAAILLKQANDPLPRPRQFTPDLPDRVEKVMLKMLAKNPGDRYQSMQEFITSVDDLLTGQFKTRQPVFPWKRARAEPTPQPGHATPPEPGHMTPPEPGYVTPSEQIQTADQPTLDAGLPVEGKPSEHVPLPAVPGGSGHDAIEIPPPILEAQPPVPEIPPPILEAPPAPAGMSVQKATWSGIFQRTKMNIRPAWVIALVGLVAVIGLAAAVVLLLRGMGRLTVQSAREPVSSGYVYFTSDQSGKAEVWYMDPKGKKVQFTHTPGSYTSWAPVPAAGGYVYFTSDESGKTEVWYMDPRGKKVQYTHTPGSYQSWAPVPAAGGYVYFTSDESGKAEAWYMDPKGKKVQYTHTPGSFKSWSPIPAAGGYVYFTSDESGKAEVWYMDSAGKKVQYTHTPDPYASWSPSPAAGGYVYYISDQSGKVEVWYTDPKGKKVQYTHTPDPYTSWSAVPGAGGYVYFTSDQSGKKELYYMDPAGKKVQYTFTPGRFNSWLLMFGKTSAITKP